MIGYIRSWIGQFKSLGRVRNTLICSVVVCLALFITYYVKVTPALGRSLRAYHVPARLVFQGVVFVALPTLSLAALKRPVNRLGLRVGQWRVWAIDVVIAYLVIFVLIVIFGRTEAFRRTYPLFHPARTSWSILLWYEAIQLVYMFAWEFLFRGYMLFGMERELGRPGAVIVQCLPFALLHMGKPELEAVGSIAAGLYLGLLALRAHSMLPCAILHFAAACTMDVFAVLVNRPG